MKDRLMTKTASEQQVVFFDTTLRDGQQCPGAGMSFEQNLAYAALAGEAGIDVLEAGFPSASELDCSIVKAIAEQAASAEKSPIIAGLCQLRSAQIDITIKALEAVIPVGRGRLHTYVPVDPRLMAASLGKKIDHARIVSQVFEFCKRAADAGLEVEFSPEGYSRVGKNFDFCTDLLRAAVEGGARILNCPDTIGGASRYQGEEFFVAKMKRHADIIRAEYPDVDITWSTHCHNDLGLAVENSIAAVFEGPARQIEGCINGVGERAGNAALEQCIMIVRQWGEGRGLTSSVETSKLQQLSDFVARHMLIRQPHSPVTGENAARHSSGGHTNAILKDPLAYQPFDPSETGKQISFVFGPLSGGNHAKSIIEEHGFICDEEEKADVAQFIKDMYKERRKGITDRELLDGYIKYRSPIRMKKINYSRTRDVSSIAFEGVFFDESGALTFQHVGKDSALRALKAAIDTKVTGCEIQAYQSESVGEHIDAQSRTTITVSYRSGIYSGVAEDQDISKSAMKALVKAVNKAYVTGRYSRNTQDTKANAA